MARPCVPRTMSFSRGWSSTSSTGTAGSPEPSAAHVAPRSSEAKTPFSAPTNSRSGLSGCSRITFTLAIPPPVSRPVAVTASRRAESVRKRVPRGAVVLRHHRVRAIVVVPVPVQAHVGPARRLVRRLRPSSRSTGTAAPPPPSPAPSSPPNVSPPSRLRRTEPSSAPIHSTPGSTGRLRHGCDLPVPRRAVVFRERRRVRHAHPSARGCPGGSAA